MKNLYKSLKKLPDITREIVTMRANGKKKIITKNITNRYLLELENGNSIAVTEKDLKDFGINEEEFKEKIEEGGFILAHWDGTIETEEKIKEETKATIRCIPLDGDKTPGKCMVTGRPSAQRVIFARAY